ncbi:hypothetical protein [Streptomyces virginiae]
MALRDPDLTRADVLGFCGRAGMCFTVALLIGEPASPGPEAGEHVKAATPMADPIASFTADADGFPTSTRRTLTANQEVTPGHRRQEGKWERHSSSPRS